MDLIVLYDMYAFIFLLGEISDHYLHYF